MPGCEADVACCEWGGVDRVDRGGTGGERVGGGVAAKCQLAYSALRCPDHSETRRCIRGEGGGGASRALSWQRFRGRDAENLHT